MIDKQLQDEINSIESEVAWNKVKAVYPVRAFVFSILLYILIYGSAAAMVIGALVVILEAISG